MATFRLAITESDDGFGVTVEGEEPDFSTDSPFMAEKYVGPDGLRESGPVSIGLVLALILKRVSDQSVLQEILLRMADTPFGEEAASLLIEAVENANDANRVKPETNNPSEISLTTLDRKVKIV